MSLKFKQRGVDDLKKVMIYGQDGTGKSTFAADYCRENQLHPVVIDVDDTNYTNLPILDLNFKTDIKTYAEIKSSIGEIRNMDEFDTIIIDGVTSLLEMLVSKAKGLKKYSDRAERFQDILRSLLSSGKHLIFIGQADMEVIYNEEFQSSKMVIKVNSIVNEKYLCYKKKEGFSHKVMKYRTLDESFQTSSINQGETFIEENSKSSNIFQTADVVGEPKTGYDPIRNQCLIIKSLLESENCPVTKSTMRQKVVKMIKAEEISAEQRPDLIRYINKHCPEELT